jgi:hypothetical protein
MTLSALGIFSAAGAGGAPVAAGSYELISSTILGSSQTSVSLNTTGLGSTYKHIQIRATMRTTEANNDGGNPFIRFNGDSGNNYAWHLLVSSGSTVVSSGDINAPSMLFGKPAGSSAASGNFGASVIDILDAFSTSKNKTHRSLSGHSNLQVGAFSGHWRSTNAITSVDIFANGPSFVAGSRFSLYGIKG